MKPVEERFIYAKLKCSKCSKEFKTTKAGIIPIHILAGHHICKGSEKPGSSSSMVAAADS